MPQKAAGDFFLILECEIEQVQGDETPSELSSGELTPDTARHQDQSSDTKLPDEIEWWSVEPPALRITSQHIGSPPEVQPRAKAEAPAANLSVEPAGISSEPAAVEEVAKEVVLIQLANSETLPVEARVRRLEPGVSQSMPVERSTSEDAGRRQLVREGLAGSAGPLGISESRPAATITIRVETAPPALASPIASGQAESKEQVPGTRPPAVLAVPTADAPATVAHLPVPPASDARLPVGPLPDASRRDASRPDVTRRLAVRYVPLGLEQQASDRTPQGETRPVGVRHSERGSLADPGQLSFAARIHLRAETDGGETRPPEQKQATPAAARAKTAASRISAPAVPQLHPRVEPAAVLPVTRTREEPLKVPPQTQGVEKRSGSAEVSSLAAEGADEYASHSRVTTPRTPPVLPAPVAGNAVRSVLPQPSAPLPEAPRMPVVEPPLNTRIMAPAAHEIQLSVAEGEQGNIHLKLVERGGKVHLAVRSTQPELASRMQQDVGKLVTRLGSEFGNTESWTPGKEVAAGSGEAAHGLRAGAGDFHGNQESNDAGGGDSRRRQDQQERPEWVTEFLGGDKNEKRFQEEVLKWLKAYRG